MRLRGCWIHLFSITFIFLTEKLSNADNIITGTKWYVPLITCICGIFAGMILLFVIQWLRRRFKNPSGFTDVAEIPFSELQWTSMKHQSRRSKTIYLVYNEPDLHALSLEFVRFSKQYTLSTMNQICTVARICKIL